MISLDTNVVVRFITRDDEVQAQQARTIILTGPVLVLTSVLMETEWVLRKSYKLTPERIHEVLSEMCGLDSVSIENEDVVRRALDAYALGMDFADSLHLSGSAGATAFATFDKDMMRRARRLKGSIPVIQA